MPVFVEAGDGVRILEALEFGPLNERPDSCCFTFSCFIACRDARSVRSGRRRRNCQGARIVRRCFIVQCIIACRDARFPQSGRRRRRESEPLDNKFSARLLSNYPKGSGYLRFCRARVRAN